MAYRYYRIFKHGKSNAVTQLQLLRKYPKCLVYMTTKILHFQVNINFNNNQITFKNHVTEIGVPESLEMLTLEVNQGEEQ